MVNYVKRIRETIGVHDAKKKNFSKHIPDGFNVGDRPIVPRFFYDGVSVQEAAAQPTSFRRTIPAQVVHVQDDSTRRTGKNFQEEFSVTDNLHRVIKKHFIERIRVADTLLRNSNAVMFDLMLRSEAFDLDDFNEYADSPPVGYTPFKIFYPGDYEGRKFMVGVRIQSADTSGRAGILGLKLNIDVPDITDRGSAEIEDGDEAGIVVPFNKTFTVPPEVYPVFAYGDTASLPEILEVTTENFTFILRDLNSPATQVSGAITWAAIGR